MKTDPKFKPIFVGYKLAEVLYTSDLVDQALKVIESCKSLWDDKDKHIVLLLDGKCHDK